MRGLGDQFPGTAPYLAGFCVRPRLPEHSAGLRRQTNATKEFRLAKGACICSRPATPATRLIFPSNHKHPLPSVQTVHTGYASLCAISCVSMRVGVCFHTFCLRAPQSPPLHLLLRLLPSLFSPSYVPVKEGRDLSKPVLSFVFLVNFFFFL